MKKNLTELVFILDRSGSMGGLEQDTIGGFNAMLTRQKEQEGEANVTTILFDHEVQLLHDRFPLKAVAPLTEKDYYVRGCTALLDAIGYGMEKMGEHSAPSAGERSRRKGHLCHHHRRLGKRQQTV